MYLSICKRSVITSGTVYMFKLHQVLNWAVESESKSHKQNHHQCNWKKLSYRAHQNQDENDSCVTSNVILWDLIWSYRPKKKEGLEIVASQSPSVSLNITVIYRLVTTSFREVQEICEYLLVITPTAVTIRIPIQNHYRAMNSLLLTSVGFVLM